MSDELRFVLVITVCTWLLTLLNLILLCAVLHEVRA